MPEIKKNVPDSRDSNLKREDQKKSHAAGSPLHGVDFFGGRKITDRGPGSSVKVKRRLPLAVDIIAGILLLAIVCGVIIGSYLLFRYYSNEYETRKVNYTVIFNATEELGSYNAMKGGELYMDVNDNTVYFGKITGVSTDGENGRVILKVSVDAKYRSGDGYSIGASRLAVGGEYKLRYLEKTLSVAVVGLNEAGGN